MRIHSWFAALCCSLLAPIIASLAPADDQAVPTRVQPDFGVRLIDERGQPVGQRAIWYRCTYTAPGSPIFSGQALTNPSGYFAVPEYVAGQAGNGIGEIVCYSPTVGYGWGAFANLRPRFGVRTLVIRKGGEIDVRVNESREFDEPRQLTPYAAVSHFLDDPAPPNLISLNACPVIFDMPIYDIDTHHGGASFPIVPPGIYAVVLRQIAVPMLLWRGLNPYSFAPAPPPAIVCTVVVSDEQTTAVTLRLPREFAPARGHSLQLELAAVTGMVRWRRNAVTGMESVPENFDFAPTFVNTFPAGIFLRPRKLFSLRNATAQVNPPEAAIGVRGDLSTLKVVSIDPNFLLPIPESNSPDRRLLRFWW